MNFQNSDDWHELALSRSRTFAAEMRKRARDLKGRESATALEHLACMGFATDIPMIERLLKSAPARIASGILLGIHFGSLRGHYPARLHARFLKTLMPILSGQHLAGSDSYERAARENAVRAAVGLNGRLAHAMMRSSMCLHPRNPAAREILWHFVHEIENGRTVKPLDPELLWPLHDAVIAGTLRTGGGLEDQIRSQVLFLAAERDPERTRREAKAVIEATQHEKRSQLCSFAKLALRRCGKAPDARAILHAYRRNRATFDRLAAGVLEVHELAEHVLQDGLPLYFYNVPDRVSVAREGLRTLKLKRVHTVFDKACAVFGPDGPPTLTRAARRQFDGLDAASQSRLEELGEDMDRHTTAMFAAVERFIQKNASLFEVNTTSARRSGRRRGDTAKPTKPTKRRP